MIEYEKYQELQSKSQKMQEDYERQLAETEESKEQALEELTEYYETKLQEKTTLLDQVGYSWLSGLISQTCVKGSPKGLQGTDDHIDNLCIVTVQVINERRQQLVYP